MKLFKVISFIFKYSSLLLVLYKCSQLIKAEYEKIKAENDAEEKESKTAVRVFDAPSVAPATDKNSQKESDNGSTFN